MFHLKGKVRVEDLAFSVLPQTLFLKVVHDFHGIAIKKGCKSSEKRKGKLSVLKNCSRLQRWVDKK
jgi:hypothetical protein